MQGTVGQGAVLFEDALYPVLDLPLTVDLHVAVVVQERAEDLEVHGPNHHPVLEIPDAGGRGGARQFDLGVCPLCIVTMSPLPSDSSRKATMASLPWYESSPDWYEVVASSVSNWPSSVKRLVSRNRK